MGFNGYVDELIEASLSDLTRRYPENNTKLHVKIEDCKGLNKIFFYAGTPKYWGLTGETDIIGDLKVRRKVKSFLRSATVPGDLKEVESAVKSYVEEKEIDIRFSY